MKSLELTTVARRLWPTRALVLLLAIGFFDLIVTAVLHANGMITELNPLMKPLLEQGEWLFAIVKSFTLIAAPAAVSSCCSTGSGSREAKPSAGSRSTGSRLTCAAAAAVTRFVAPGPMDVVTAIMRRRWVAFANPIAACAIDCSL